MTSVRKKHTVLWLLTVFLLGVPEAVGFCNSPQPRLVRAEYSQSEAVVIAHLVKSQHINPKDDQDYRLYTLQVEKILRGSAPSQFVLWDENSSGRLGFDVLRGRKYLLFVDRWTEKGWWTADGCGNSGEVSKAAKALREIQRAAALRDALITGAVKAATPVAHAKVLALRKNDGKQFETQTRDDGTFALTVPSGEYSVKITAGEKNFVTHWLSYENAESVKLESGGCAQIQFVSSDSSDARSAPSRH